jgi:hypothetical protein
MELHKRKVRALGTHREIWFYRLRHTAKFRNVYRLVTVVHLMLAMFERPSMLHHVPVHHQGFQQAWDASWWHDMMEANLQPLIYGVEICCLVWYALGLWIERQYMKADFWKSHWVVARIVILVLISTNLLAVLIADAATSCTHGAAHRSSREAIKCTPHKVMYLMRCLRPIFLIQNLRHARHIFTGMVGASWKMRNMMYMLSLLLLFFSMVAYSLFRGLDGRICAPTGGMTHDPVFCSVYVNDPSHSANCRDYFKTIWSTMYQMFVLLTTSNFPDIMMPAYECNAFTPIFFILYLLLGLYLMFSLFLAVACTHFEKHAQSRLHLNNGPLIDLAHMKLCEYEYHTQLVRGTSLRPDAGRGHSHRDSEFQPNPVASRSPSEFGDNGDIGNALSESKTAGGASSPPPSGRASDGHEAGLGGEESPYSFGGAGRAGGEAAAAAGSSTFSFVRRGSIEDKPPGFGVQTWVDYVRAINPSHTEIADTLFEAADVDKDGVLYKEEFHDLNELLRSSEIMDGGRSDKFSKWLTPLWNLIDRLALGCGGSKLRTFNEGDRVVLGMTGFKGAAGGAAEEEIIVRRQTRNAMLEEVKTRSQQRLSTRGSSTKGIMFSEDASGSLLASGGGGDGGGDGIELADRGGEGGAQMKMDMLRQLLKETEQKLKETEQQAARGTLTSADSFRVGRSRLGSGVKRPSILMPPQLRTPGGEQKSFLRALEDTDIENTDSDGHWVPVRVGTVISTSHSESGAPLYDVEMAVEAPRGRFGGLCPAKKSSGGDRRERFESMEVLRGLPSGSLLPWTLRRRLSALMRSPRYTLVSDFLVFVSAILVGTQFHLETSGTTPNRMLAAMACSTFLLALFGIELFLKWFVHEPFFLSFWFDQNEKWLNRLDTVAIIGGIVTVHIDFCNFCKFIDPSLGDDPAMCSSLPLECKSSIGGASASSNTGAGLKIIVLMRLMRCVRVMRIMRGFRDDIAVIGRMVPLLGRYMVVLLCWYYMCGCIAMEVFGGSVNEHFRFAAEGAFGEARYWRNNFDSLYNTMITLFELMVVNNWVRGSVGSAGGRGACLYHQAPPNLAVLQSFVCE